MKQDCRFELPDGRTLAYAEYGDPRGAPEFYFPGFPGSRLEGIMMDEVAARLSVRIIAIDRPGMGLSTGKPGRTLLDMADDISELANGLGLKKFAVIGHSGGGAYAAACAMKIPGRLSSTGMISSIAPVDFPGTGYGLLKIARCVHLAERSMPRMVRRLRSMTARCVERHARKIVSSLTLLGSAPDRLVLAQRTLREQLIASHVEAVRTGPGGVFQDLEVLTSPWGFRIEDIPVTIDLWHGKLDTVVPCEIGYRLAQTLPQCRSRFYSDEGHVSVPINRMSEILAAMAV